MLFTEIFDKFLADPNDHLWQFLSLRNKVSFDKWDDNTSNSNHTNPAKLIKENKKMVRELLEQLDLYLIVEELSKMKIYYQINHDPRRPDNKALYAKALCPKLGKVLKKKHIGINFGALSKHPEGWTEKNKMLAKADLMKMGFRLITGK
jgi:hypothetical protein